MFYYVFKLQCTVDGSAFVGIKPTGDISWGEAGTFWSLGVRPNTKKFNQKVQQYGMKPWRLVILQCTTERELAERTLNSTLEPIKSHPLCLNYDEEAHKAANLENLKKAIPAAIEANTGDPRTVREKKKISKGMKKFMEKKAAQNAAAGQPDLPLTEGPSGHRWIHNPTTNEEMMIYVDEDLLTGFEEGRLPKKA